MIAYSCSSPSRWSYAPNRGPEVSYKVSKAWSFFSVSKQGPCLTAIKESGDDERLAQREPAVEG